VSVDATTGDPLPAALRAALEGAPLYGPLPHEWRRIVPWDPGAAVAAVHRLLVERAGERLAQLAAQRGVGASRREEGSGRRPTTRISSPPSGTGAPPLPPIGLGSSTAKRRRCGRNGPAGSRRSTTSSRAGSRSGPSACTFSPCRRWPSLSWCVGAAGCSRWRSPGSSTRPGPWRPPALDAACPVRWSRPRTASAAAAAFPRPPWLRSPLRPSRRAQPRPLGRSRRLRPRRLRPPPYPVRTRRPDAIRRRRPPPPRRLIAVLIGRLVVARTTQRPGLS
jgi:hypothetical protein